MRTTLSIDDDVFYVAKERAKLEKRTMGEVVSELARAGVASTPPAEPSDNDKWLESRGWELMPHRGVVVTNEDVNRIREELGI
jgi:hypothetical protein